MALIDRVKLVIQRIASDVKAIKPRIIPAGGTANAVLTKSSATDYAVGWTRPKMRFTFPCSDKPAAAEKFGPVAGDLASTIPAGFVGSIASAAVAATAAAVFKIQRNGSDIGTLTFNANATVGTFGMSTNADVALAAGDRLTLIGPSTQDSTLADVTVLVVSLL